VKKVLLLVFVSILMVVLFASCSSKGGYQYFFSGFITLKDDQVEAYPHDTFVIETDEDWHDFMDRYVPGIPYNLTVDYSKEYLVFNVVFPAKPTYSIGTDIKDFIVTDNKLEPEYSTFGANGIANGIYAQNIDGVLHCFVNIVTLNKEGVPAGISNIYHKK